MEIWAGLYPESGQALFGGSIWNTWSFRSLMSDVFIADTYTKVDEGLEAISILHLFYLYGPDNVEARSY